MAVAALFELLADDATPVGTVLEAEYGAELRLDTGSVAVNFVSTIDGVVSYGLERGDSRAVGGGAPADRLLMAMLRAVAGVVVVGAATLRATLDHQWTAAALAPDRADDLADLRAAAGRPPEPAPLLIVSSDGVLPSQAQAVASPETPIHVVTPAGLDTRPATASGRVPVATILAGAHALAEGGPVLCEGGPTLLGSLLAAATPLDLFLTVAPQLAGRQDGNRSRRSLVEGVELPPFARPATLRSVRRSAGHLLLRYTVGGALR